MEGGWARGWEHAHTPAATNASRFMPATQAHLLGLHR